MRILFALLLFAPVFLLAQNGQEWLLKTDPHLLDRLDREKEAEFLVILQQQADTRAAARFKTKEEKGRYVYEKLLATAETTQQGLRQLLKTAQAPIQTYWIVNMVWTKGNLSLLQQIAALPEVARIEDNPVVHFDFLPENNNANGVIDRLTPISWGLTKIKADSVWIQTGHKGATVVVGGQDTGYEATHPAIRSKYRGWNGSSFNHHYNWHDAIHAAINGGTNSCGINLMAPCDDHDHGTHTVGTMCGGPNSDSIIGVAPEAKWIGCRNMEEGDGTPSTYIECFEWFVAPTDLNGSNADPNKAPHVINNSWGCPVSEGCNSGNFATMETAVNNVRNAGILVVVSAGNSGSGCSTVDAPAAIYTNSFTVGATQNTTSDAIANFSSRGPVNVYAPNPKKPNIAAPGVSIKSCVGHDNNSGTYAYASWNGTSMAGPHVAGVAALMMSANTALKGNVSTLEDLMEQSAVARFASAPFCGGDNASTRPNNVYGWGRVNALAAVNAAIALPVELLDFQLKKEQKSVLLSWQTATESNCVRFVVQHSTDGYQWENIGELNCAGNSLTVQSYTFAHDTPLPGLNFYRLHQMDWNGSGVYSNALSLRWSENELRLRAQAQYSMQSLYTDISGAEVDPQWILELYSADGRLAQRFPALQSGIFALPYLASGLYVLHLKDDTGQSLAVEKLWWAY